ncbi:MAG: hypothetical protein MR413_03985 [Clostridia bacterium]|nr:hypothetical protein [Clostridia bacterium]
MKRQNKIMKIHYFRDREWSVYQPLQRRGVINAASIKALRTTPSVLTEPKRF